MRNRWVRTILWCPPGVSLLAAIPLFSAGADDLARMLAVAGIGFLFLFLVPSLPIYTRSRSRIVRHIKWAVLAGMPVLALGNEVPRYSWLLVACLWPVFWIEYARTSIRRKLPLAAWPRHLFL